MADLIIEALDLAKTFQWEIAQDTDPATAALRAARAIVTIEHVHDERLMEGTGVIVHAFGAFVFNHWLPDEERAISLQFDQVVAYGDSAGISFFQNLGNPRIQTLFVGLRNTRVLERQAGEVDLVESPLVAPTLVVPVLGIESVQIAA